VLQPRNWPLANWLAAAAADLLTCRLRVAQALGVPKCPGTRRCDGSPEP
jgi:hypothetical protein